MKNHLLIFGIALIVLGICFLCTYWKEKSEKYILVQGKVTEVLKSLDPNRKGFGFTYTPIIEYQYGAKGTKQSSIVKEI